MNVYTIEMGGAVARGIALSDGALDLGRRPVDHKPMRIPVNGPRPQG